MSKETAVEYMFRLLDVMTFDKDSESADIWEAIYHRALAMEREQMRLPNCNPINSNIESVTIFDPVTGETLYKGGEQ
jgi:hypothetical protein